MIWAGSWGKTLPPQWPAPKTKLNKKNYYNIDAIKENNQLAKINWNWNKTNFCSTFTLLIEKVRSASRLIKNLPAPLGTLVKKRARLKPAACYIVYYISYLFLMLSIVWAQLGNVPWPLTLFQWKGRVRCVIHRLGFFSCIHQIIWTIVQFLAYDEGPFPRRR